MAQTTKIEYSHPEVLVDTRWVEEHINDKKIRIVEVDYDSAGYYYLGHISDSVLLDWRKDINDPLRRDILSIEKYVDLLRRLGVNNDDTDLILYGDFNNWFAAFAFWVFKYYNYPNVRLINGGRRKLLDEDRPLEKEIVKVSRGEFKISESFKPNEKIRVYLSDIQNALVSRRKFQIRLVDVGSPPEFNGVIASPPEYPTEHAQRAGHIPGAHNIPWAQVLNEDGTFKSAEELLRLYESKNILRKDEVITYCRIGERSSPSWFVLTWIS
ncbi:Sulfur carrier protein TtuD [Candidatus Nitrosocosmicus franklandus]|uniref:Sulfur carrier protein TtuD n=1 Tax=Candidatus Nitrosocosmicus franklandianus TaxID=1798806 RepID=A0A484IC71_9ARCH|nr:sulfurtransferase [Candidatus Nitrosocosmicus franklandus]VFJ15373.1 Sulfur carrier protein TtuD [Candidatus Nitrosocosmicus franklandus]